jgi:hypothetical protein
MDKLFAALASDVAEKRRQYAVAKYDMISHPALC